MGTRSTSASGFFAERKVTGQSLWMDLALARHSGQELRNTYTLTGSPDFAPLSRFFKASVDQLQLLYDDMPLPGCTMPPKPARHLLASMKDEIYESSVSTDDTLTRGSPVEELVVEESPVDISTSLSTNYGPSFSFASSSVSYACKPGTYRIAAHSFPVVTRFNAWNEYCKHRFTIAHRSASSGQVGFT